VPSSFSSTGWWATVPASGRLTASLAALRSVSSGAVGRCAHGQPGAGFLAADGEGEQHPIPIKSWMFARGRASPNAASAEVAFHGGRWGMRSQPRSTRMAGELSPGRWRCLMKEQRCAPCSGRSSIKASSSRRRVVRRRLRRSRPDGDVHGREAFKGLVAQWRIISKCAPRVGAIVEPRVDRRETDSSDRRHDDRAHVVTVKTSAGVFHAKVLRCLALSLV